MAIALRRDALQAEAVETAALRRSDDVKTALLRAVSHDLRTPLTAIVAAGHALAQRLADRRGADRAERRGRRRGRAARAAGRQAARPLAAPGRRRRAAARLGLARGRGARRARGPVRDASRGEVRHRDRPRRAAGARRRRPARARVREPARERAPLLGRPAGVGPRAPQRPARAWCASSTRGRGSAPAERERIFEPFYRGPGAAAEPWTGSGLGPRDREGVRRGQRRHDLGRVAARPGDELRGLAADRAAASPPSDRPSRRRRCPP